MTICTSATELTAEKLRQFLFYDPDSGQFTWLIANNNRIKVGGVAGCLDNNGYLQIRLERRFYKAHRLAWLYTHGSWPNGVIDHIDGDPSNCRLGNLRDVSQTTNQQNQRRAQKNSKSGLLGAWFDAKSQKWQSQICLPNGKRKNLGFFKSAEQAHSAYIAAKRRFHEGGMI